MIDFAQRGWPAQGEDAKRLARYKRGKLLYEGRHKELFWDTKVLPERLRKAVYLTLNYPGIITRVAADLLVLEPPQFSHSDEAWNERLKRLVECTCFHVRLYEMAVSMGYRGDGVYRIRRDLLPGGEQQTVIEAVPAYSYFVELDPGNCRRVLSEAVAWEVRDGDQRFLRVEHHEPGLVTQEAFILDKEGRNPRPVAVEPFLEEGQPPLEETGLPFSLLVHVPNQRSDDDFWGMWDYGDGLESLFEEANMRLTQISHILDKHTTPKLVGPEIYLDEAGELDASEAEYLIAEGALGKDLPRMLTWDAHLEAAFRQFETVVDHISRMSDIAPAVFGADSMGNVESAPAMRLRYLRTITKTKRKRLYIAPATKMVLWKALLVDAYYGRPEELRPAARDLAQPTIQWRDGLPRDVHQVVQTEVARVTAGLSSRRSALMRIDEVNEVAAELELEQIAAEGEGAPEPAPEEMEV